MCDATSQSLTGGYNMTQYIYDAEGHRVGKGTITSLTCDWTSNGFVLTTVYTLGPGGEQMSEQELTGGTVGTLGTAAWVHTNVYAAGSLIATYLNDESGPHFHLTDWLGTFRAQTNYAGSLEQTCQSLPFGDAVPCVEATEQFFTGQERDSESGLDYFGARHYGSLPGRFTSPDPSGLAYADIANPQSFNLYAYAANNPLRYTDPTGLACSDENGNVISGYDNTSGNPEYDCWLAGGDNYTTYNTTGSVVNGVYTLTVQLASVVSFSDDGSSQYLSLPATQADSPAPNNSQAPSNQQLQQQINQLQQQVKQLQQQQQPKQQPWYCGTGNSWSHPATAPTGRQYGLWAVSDAAIATYSTKVTGGKPNPVSEVFTAASLIEAWGWAACN